MTDQATRAVATRGQVLDAIYSFVARPGEPWTSVLLRARLLALDLTGLHIAMVAIDQFHAPDGELLPDRVPIAAMPDGRPRPGIAAAVSEAGSLLGSRWHQVLYRYGWLAQTLVDAIASGDAHVNPFEVARGEPTAPDGTIEPPPCRLPDALWDDPAWAGVRTALGRLHAAQAAAAEYNELVFVEDPDTGETVEYLPEHMIGVAAELEAAADDWPHGVAEYADAVVHLLATRPELLQSERPDSAGEAVTPLTAPAGER